MQYAGRIGGGEIKYVFNNAVEDSNSSVIAELKAMLTSCTSDLLKIYLLIKVKEKNEEKRRKFLRRKNVR